MEGIKLQFAPHFTQIPSSTLSESKAHFNVKWQGTSVSHKVTHRGSNLHKGVSCLRRRRRANVESDTYVLMEPGKNEEFVSEDELRDRLKGWLENWNEPALPPDLARFDTIDDAVQYLVKSVCELELDGEVGSVQWYQVRLD